MMANIDILVKELVKLPKEVGWVEFKHNNCQSRLIKEAVEMKRIKALDPDTARRYMKYIPIWA